MRVDSMNRKRAITAKYKMRSYQQNLGDAMKAILELNLGCHPSFPGFSDLSFIGSKVVIWADGKIIWYEFNCGAWTIVYGEARPGLKIGTPVPDGFGHLLGHRSLWMDGYCAKS
ncbi:hypothetical protein GOBAR_DD06595 [Gossypium barbadense]|nr:hypothetical protein GOBAR_DD06595 [Gossypium barbadense]